MWKTFVCVISTGAAALCAQAQPADAATDCPAAWEMDSRQLQGDWQVRFADGGTAVLHLGPHPEWQAMVRGNVQRGERRTAMVGDVHEGQLTLEESDNGTTISATWLGDVVEDSCAREIRGEWQSGDETQPARPFVLRKPS